MGVILDSCIWVELTEGQLEARDVIRVTKNQPVYTSVVTLGELHFGVEACADPAERARRAASLQRIVSRPILDISSSTASAFGILAASVKRTGRSPRPRYNDLWIAAQAIENGYLLLTLNLADFRDLPGLRVASPMQGSARNDGAPRA